MNLESFSLFGDAPLSHRVGKIRALIMQVLIDDIFNYCVYILVLIGDITGMGYNLANIVIFVLLQPGLILLFMYLWLREKRKKNIERRKQ